MSLPNLIPDFEAVIASLKIQLPSLVTELDTVLKDKLFRAELPKLVQNQLSTCSYGHQDAGWLAFYNFMDEVAQAKECEPMRGFQEVAKHAGWWWPFDGVCIVTERPIAIHHDERERLHCENDAAIKYSDGFGIYTWHGTRVPKWIITEPETITADKVDAERNAEIRRVMLERLGVEKYMAQAGAEVIHQDVDALGFPRRLLRKNPKNGADPVLVVELTNSTPEPDGTRKKYMLRVHPELRPLKPNRELGEPQDLTCHNAVASTFGMTGPEYKLSVET